MNVSKVIMIGGIVGVLLLVLIPTIMYFSVSNSEIRLRQRVEAQQKKNEAVFDNMWKILSQQAQVSEQYKEAFRTIYPDLIKGRYSDGSGSLMKWIQEQNPNFDTSLYNKLMNSIEAYRNQFTVNQNMLIDLKREHDTMLKTFPNSIFIGSRSEIKINIITSDRTEHIFQSQKENDVKLF